MGSENPIGGDNQQETIGTGLDPWWIVGFTDGEGCFSVSIHHNPRYAARSFGWQINPVFHLYQHESHGDVLEDVATYFGCGTIRPKGPSSSVLTYTVGRRRDLESTIIPFFEQHPLIVKGRDFAAFARIVAGLRAGVHFEAVGFDALVRLAFSMNANGKQRARTLDEILMGSSETARQARLSI